MPRINEHVFKLNGVEYRLTYLTGDKPRIFKDDEELKVNISDLLRKYLRELGYELEQLIGKTTQQLSNLILNHFSDKKTKQKVKNPIPKKLKLKKEAKTSLFIQEKLELSDSFKVVMICSGGKNDSTFDDFQGINFKADGNSINEFHPDEKMPNSAISWRVYLEEHQKDKNLLMAYELYSRNEYRCLYKKFGNSFYILSAGWGLVSSEFKLPNYDITFSNNANIGAKRSKNIDNLPIYNDFNQLKINDNEDIIFIGSPDYLKLFIILTQNLPNRKIIYWKSKSLKRIYPNDTFEYRYFQTNTNTNWHYELAYAIACGIIP